MKSDNGGRVWGERGYTKRKLLVENHRPRQGAEGSHRLQESTGGSAQGRTVKQVGSDRRQHYPGIHKEFEGAVGGLRKRQGGERSSAKTHKCVNHMEGQSSRKVEAQGKYIIKWRAGKETSAQTVSVRGRAAHLRAEGQISICREDWSISRALSMAPDGTMMDLTMGGGGRRGAGFKKHVNV